MGTDSLYQNNAKQSIQDRISVAEEVRRGASEERRCSVTHKLRTLQGQYRSAVHRNSELAAELDCARKRAFIAERNYREAIQRSVSVGICQESHLRNILTIRLDLSDLNSIKSQIDALVYLNNDISRKAGWKL